ncbi:MAG TPA: hypothetical protein VLX29_06745 [Nitrospirota bacterium]|nr:hypothetical protein [Nitrospirota bacterium]
MGVITTNKVAAVPDRRTSDEKYGAALKRVFRTDPMARFNGRTYGGISVPRTSKRYIIRVAQSEYVNYLYEHERMDLARGKVERR